MLMQLRGLHRAIWIQTLWRSLSSAHLLLQRRQQPFSAAGHPHVQARPLFDGQYPPIANGRTTSAHFERHHRHAPRAGAGVPVDLGHPGVGRQRKNLNGF